MSCEQLQQKIDEYCQEGYDPDAIDEITEIVVLFLGEGEGKKKVGAGKIRILQQKDNKRYRVVMRDNAGAVLLNHYILPNISIEDDLEYILYKTMDYADPKGEEKSIFLKFPESRADFANKFIQKFKEAQKNNDKLINGK